jgi:hypothetical protein
VEHVSFLPNGGQAWIRDLQIRIPRAAPGGQSYQIVSLGLYARRRLPDFEVRDATGKRLDLLTRHQHGEAITQSVLLKHLRDFTGQMSRIQLNRHAYRIYRTLYGSIYELVTSVGDVPDDEQEQNAYPIVSIYENLLDRFGVAPSDAITRVEAFARHVIHLQRKTQYLCWVRAEPGEVLSLAAKHTTADARRKQAYQGIFSALRTFWHGIANPHQRGRKVRAEWYTEFGLAPINYDFSAPGQNQTGSYYFTLRAPESTDITYIDFEHFNNFQDKGNEFDCSLHNVHIHNTEGVESDYSPRKRLIRAYLRCSSHGHKQIAAGALLNIVFVILVARSGFKAVTSNSAQIWLLATPTILTAYLVEQQRHYYAYATRRQRAILWIYLTISVTFLVVVSFHLAHRSVDSSHWDRFSTAIGILLIVSSVAVFVLYTLLGYSFRLITTVRTRKKLNDFDKELVEARERLQREGKSSAIIDKVIEQKIADEPSSWQRYDKVVHRYCSVVVLTVVLISALAGISTKWWWNFPASTSPHISKLPTASEILSATDPM